MSFSPYKLRSVIEGYLVMNNWEFWNFGLFWNSMDFLDFLEFHGLLEFLEFHGLFGLLEFLGIPWMFSASPSYILLALCIFLKCGASGAANVKLFTLSVSDVQMEQTNI